MDKPSGMKEGIALIDIDLKNIDRVRKEWPFLKDRKPENYQEICNSDFRPYLPTAGRDFKP
jgi:predicted amidohydrolase